MMIVCGGIKGGTGKTTIATNLATHRARTHDVLLVDADEQGSATIFTGIRKSEWPDLPQFTSIILRDEQVRRELERMTSRYDDVIIDTGGRDTRSQRAGLSIADILLLPFNPRSLDIWTIENVEVLLKEIWSINPNLKAISLLNRADVQGSDNADTIEILSDLDGITYAGVSLVNRKAYGRAVAQGLSVWELKQRDQKAEQEALALFQYIFNSIIEPLQNDNDRKMELSDG
jgi:chromosome partitioning protein